MVQIHKTQHHNGNSPSTQRLTFMIVAIPTSLFIASCWVWGNWPLSLFPNNQNPPPQKVVVQKHSKDPEGYWPDADICLKLGSSVPLRSLWTKENADCPQWRMHRSEWYADRKTVIQRLGEIEAVAKSWEQLLMEMTPEQFQRCGGTEESVKPPVWIARQRGLAFSRIQEGDLAGNSEYHTDAGQAWTDALLPMYMEQYSVEPSEEFQSFVLSFDVDGFRTALSDLKKRMGPP